MKDLIEVGTLTPELAAQFEDYVTQRKNILICGGTSSGKTTLANVLTEFIPDHERIVLIEDTAEIQIHKENVLRFEARREQNGLPAVTIRDLLKATLRLLPGPTRRQVHQVGEVPMACARKQHTTRFHELEDGEYSPEVILCHICYVPLVAHERPT
jgi:Flp pilus assembly CpaF family ATPase